MNRCKAELLLCTNAGAMRTTILDCMLAMVSPKDIKDTVALAQQTMEQSLIASIRAPQPTPF